MINIRPVSDLRNKYPEIEDLVLNENEAVYLTKKWIWFYGSNEFRKVFQLNKRCWARKSNFGKIQ